MSKKVPKHTFAFDIGHSSIGWAVMECVAPTVQRTASLLGAGVVTFGANDCLASQRRDFRRQRRHIRSTRQRIERIKRLLRHLNVLEDSEMDSPGHPAPHWLAAGVLAENKTLNWLEIWHVLRWYAHNRGYDGNRRWSKIKEDSEDTEKESNAIRAMEHFGTNTMAETFCKIIEIDPDSERFSSHLAAKTQNMAFPRETVMAEVVQILEAHIGVLPNLDQPFIDTLVESPARTKDSPPAWQTIAVPDIQLPVRYVGGLLFGQLKPRFDNRIMIPCRITGKNPPAKHCMDFFRYRWARLVANMRVNGQPFSKAARKAVTVRMAEKGSLTVTELVSAVEEATGASLKETNIEAMFTLHPDSKDALVLDPALALFYGRGPGSKNLKPYWTHLPDLVRSKALNRWKKGKRVDLNWMIEATGNAGEEISPLQNEIDKAFASDRKKPRPKFVNKEKFFAQSFGPQQVSGRSPYSRKVMQQVWKENIEEGFDATKPCLQTNPNPAIGEKKTKDGILYASKETRAKDRNRTLAEMTNNHLIRHRLFVLEERLLPDLVSEFCNGEKAHVANVIVEVNRDLQEHAGMTRKEIATELNSRMRDFKSAVKYLEDNVPGMPLNGSLIRKARIAMDLGWRCPFTGKSYGPDELQTLNLEHIIPYSLRRTNALHALVLTWPSVNAMKGQRTAMEFIQEFGGQDVPGLNGKFSIVTKAQFEEFVNKLDTKGHPEDLRRKRNRKNALLVEKYDPKSGHSETDFTDGMLTQTSQMVRLACRRIEKFFPNLILDDETDEERRRVFSIPGRVTGEIRKAWDLAGTLALACPEILDEKKKTLPKDDIRGITHLHHALDAIVLALTSRYFPRNGKVWKLITKRKLTEPEQQELRKLCPLVKFSSQGGLELIELPTDVKNEISRSLAQCRVMQHISADQTGVKAEQNPWRVVAAGEEEVVLLQREAFKIVAEEETKHAHRIWDEKNLNSTTEMLLNKVSCHLSRAQVNGIRRGKIKLKTEKREKLLGLSPVTGETGKLSRLQAALILGENYGLALDPTPQIIPHHKVSDKLSHLRKANEGKPIRVIRKGMIIRVLTNPPGNKQDYSGLWQVTSIKNNKSGPAIDIVRPGYITGKNGVEWAGMNKNIVPLIKAGLEIVECPYTGVVKI